jgi:phage terminase large subunit-like protein
VEGDGKGEEFIQVIQRNPGLKIMPLKTGGRGKDIRLVRQMGPWLENGTVRVSDAETPFLQELRRELDNYPLVDHDDALDAVYWALRGIPDVLSLREEEELPETVSRRHKKQVNPFISLGRYQG